MKLSKLIHEVWKDERVKNLGLRKKEVAIVVNVVLDKILKGLITYGKVKLLGLFTLEVRKAKGRKIAHPITHEEMYSSDYYKVGIEPSKRLKDKLKEYEE